MIERGAGEGLRIRAASTADASAIQAIYAPVVRDTAISFELEVPTPAAMGARIASTLERFPFVVATNGDGLVLGYAYAGPHRSRAAYAVSVDVTVYVHGAARGQGVGRALYGSLLPQLERGGFHNAFAGITLPNAPSVGLHETMGFRPVGVFSEVGKKFGRYHDVGWWQRRL